MKAGHRVQTCSRSLVPPCCACPIRHQAPPRLRRLPDPSSYDVVPSYPGLRTGQFPFNRIADDRSRASGKMDVLLPIPHSYRLDAGQAEQVMTPALLIYPAVVQANIDATLKLAGGDANRWRP